MEHTPYQNANILFTEVVCTILKCVWNHKKSWVAKTILKRKNLEDSHFLISKLTTKLQQSLEWGGSSSDWARTLCFQAPWGDSLSKRGLLVSVHFLTLFWADPDNSLASNWGHLLLHTFMKNEWIGHRETHRGRLEPGFGKKKGRNLCSVSLSPPALQRLKSWCRGMP